MSFDFSGGLSPKEKPPKRGSPVGYVFSRLGWRLLFVMVFITAVAYGLYMLNPLVGARLM